MRTTSSELPGIMALALADGRRLLVRAALVDDVRGVDRHGDPVVALFRRETASHRPELLVALTPCCQAHSKGAESPTGVVCRACHREVPARFGTTSELAMPLTGGRPMPAVRTADSAGRLLVVTADGGDGDPHLIRLAVPFGPDRQELRDRVYAALANSALPAGRIVDVQVDRPGSVPPAAAVAVAALAAIIEAPAARLADTAVLGDVGIDGSLRATPDLPAAVHALNAHGVRQVILPATAVEHPGPRHALAENLVLLAAHRLDDVARWLHGDDTALPRHDVGAFPAGTEVR